MEIKKKYYQVQYFFIIILIALVLLYSVTLYSLSSRYQIHTGGYNNHKVFRLDRLTGDVLEIKRGQLFKTMEVTRHHPDITLDDLLKEAETQMGIKPKPLQSKLVEPKPTPTSKGRTELDELLEILEDQ